MAETHQKLPVDILHSILLRVPFKPLTTFLSVSKPFHSLISSQLFKKNYTHHNTHKHPLILVTQQEDIPNTTNTLLTISSYNHQSVLVKSFTKTVPAEPGYSFEPYQSCLGLVCLGFFWNKRIMVCNPATEQLITLPEPVCRGFENCIGFGYAESSQEFKVVRFFQERVYEEHSCCEVYTLGGNGGWRKAKNPPYLPRWGAPLVNGAVHLLPSVDYEVEEDPYLLAFDEFYGVHEERLYCITAFDVDTEEYMEIRLPEFYFSEAARSICPTCVNLVEIKGLLCLSFDFFRSEKMMELWFLKDYEHGEWVKGYTIDLSSEGSDVTASALAFVGDKKILMRVYLGNDEESELSCYNTEEDCFEEKIVSNCYATSYVERFVALGSLCNMQGKSSK